MTDVAPAILQERWLHSHEEDTPTEMVFRPASFHFAPSRGRMGFELKPDKTVIDIGIAPTDGPQESSGRWKLVGKQLVFSKSPDTPPHRSFEIVSASSDRLVVKK